MKKNNNQDWRLIGYDGHLDGQTFTFLSFQPTEKNDHEHCEFCCKKITKLQIPNDDCDLGGYCCFNSKTNQTNWVCEECFSLFKDKFNFKMK